MQGVASKEVANGGTLRYATKLFTVSIDIKRQYRAKLVREGVTTIPWT